MSSFIRLLLHLNGMLTKEETMHLITVARNFIQPPKKLSYNRHNRICNSFSTLFSFPKWACMICTALRIGLKKLIYFLETIFNTGQRLHIPAQPQNLNRTNFDQCIACPFWSMCCWKQCTLLGFSSIWYMIPRQRLYRIDADIKASHIYRHAFILEYKSNMLK